MMELTQDVWWCLFVTHLAARHWTFSILFMLFAECGSQTVAGLGGQRPYMLFLLFSCFRFLGFF